MKWAAYWILFVATLHLGLAVVLYGDIYAGFWASGIWNSVDTVDEKLALWFGMGGLFLYLLGLCFIHMPVIPISVGLGLFVLSLLGVVLVPKSGFWFLLIPSLAMLGRRLYNRPKLDR